MPGEPRSNNLTDGITPGYRVSLDPLSEITQIRPGREVTRDEGSTVPRDQQLPHDLRVEIEHFLAQHGDNRDNGSHSLPVHIVVEDGRALADDRPKDVSPTFDATAALPASEFGPREPVNSQPLGSPIAEPRGVDRFGPTTPGESIVPDEPGDSQDVTHMSAKFHAPESVIQDTPEVAAYREKVEYAIDEIKQGEQIDDAIRNSAGGIGEAITKILPSSIRRAIYQNRAMLLKVGGVVMPSAFAGALVTIGGYGVAIGIDIATGLSIAVPPLAPVAIGGVAAAGVGWLMWRFGKRVAHEVAGSRNERYEAEGILDHGQLEFGAQIPVPRVRMRPELRARILASSNTFAAELRQYANIPRSQQDRNVPFNGLLGDKHPNVHGNDLEVLYQSGEGSVGEDAAGWIARQLFHPQDARSRARASLNDFLVQELSRRPEQFAIIRSPHQDRRDFAVLVPHQFCTPKSIAILQEGVGQAGILLPMINPPLVREGLEIFRARGINAR